MCFAFHSMGSRFLNMDLQNDAAEGLLILCNNLEVLYSCRRLSCYMEFKFMKENDDQLTAIVIERTGIWSDYKIVSDY